MKAGRLPTTEARELQLLTVTRAAKPSRSPLATIRSVRMQLLPQRPPHLRPQHIDEVLFGGLLHAGDAAEALEEEAAALLADAGEIVELTVQGPLRAAAAVGGNGEAVRLVAHHLQELQ